MHDFVYVTKASAKPVRDELIQIIHQVQDIVRPYFTFQFKPVGSSSMNMITFDRKSNIGFDFDFDLSINDDDEDYTPTEIRNIIRNAIDQVTPKYGYKHCEDSTGVLTIKKVNTFTSTILHSCDFALVYNCRDGRKQYIRYNKKQNNYTWEYQGNSYKNLNSKITYNNPDKHSRSLLAESINEMCQMYHNS